MTTEEKIETMRIQILTLRRRMQALMAGGMLVILGAFVSAATHNQSPQINDEILSRKFIVIDAQGNKRAALDEYGLTLTDIKGKNRLAVWLLEGAPDITMLDAEGGIRVKLFTADSGQSFFGMNDSKGASRTVMAVQPDGTAAVEMQDANENRRIGLRVQDSTPSITIYDAKEQGRGQLSMNDKGSPFISVIGANGKSMAGLMINDDETPRFDMRDETGKPRVLLSYLPNGTPFMGFKDSRGNPVWRVP
jgi:hypothetical protein